MKHGKKYVDAAKLVDRTKLYDTNDTVRNMSTLQSSLTEQNYMIQTRLWTPLSKQPQLSLMKPLSFT